MLPTCLGLHSKLRKLHRKLGDDLSLFKHIFDNLSTLFCWCFYKMWITDMFWTICRPFWCFHLAELIDLKCSGSIVEEDDPTFEPLQTLSRFMLVFSDIFFLDWA